MNVTTGPAYARELVTVYLTGFDGSIPANLVVMAYQGSTLCAIAQNFSGSSVAEADMDLNTAEMESAIGDRITGGISEFDLYVYDSSVPVMLASGILEVRATRDLGTAPPVTPISSTTQFIGSFAFYNGLTYVRSSTDGLYYEFDLSGSGETATPSTGTVGITIPGAPSWP
jgi:hypothetical protein